MVQLCHPQQMYERRDQKLLPFSQLGDSEVVGLKKHASTSCHGSQIQTRRLQSDVRVRSYGIPVFDHLPSPGQAHTHFPLNRHHHMHLADDPLSLAQLGDSECS